MFPSGLACARESAALPTSSSLVSVIVMSLMAQPNGPTVKRRAVATSAIARPERTACLLPFLPPSRMFLLQYVIATQEGGFSSCASSLTRRAHRAPAHARTTGLSTLTRLLPTLPSSTTRACSRISSDRCRRGTLASTHREKKENPYRAFFPSAPLEFLRTLSILQPFSHHPPLILPDL